MPFSSLFGNKKEKVSLLIDIGSGRVTGAFVAYTQEKIPRLLKQASMSYARDTLSQFTSQNSPKKSELKTDKEEITENMIQSVNTILAQLFAEKISVADIVVTFSSPWCMVSTKHVHLEQPKKFIITQAFLDTIIQTESKNFTQELKKEKEDELSGEMVGIEKNILHAEVNGYMMENPLTMHTTVFDLHVYLSAIKSSVFNTLVQTLFKYTHMSHDKVTMHTFPFESCAVLKTQSQMDYLFMDVLDDATCLLLVQQGTPTQSVSFPSGTSFVIRKVAENCTVSPEIARSMLSVVFSGNADAETTERIRGILEDIEKEWAIYFEDALISLDKNIALPADIFLSVSANLAPLYTEFLGVSKADATALYRKKVRITTVTSDTYASRYQHDPKYPFDVHIAVSALFHGMK